jgi:tetratricopeptide (TPR) repeat protein
MTNERRMHMSSWLKILKALAIAVVLAGPAAARAGQTDLDLEARTHFAAGDYQAALDIYARLYAQTLHPTYLRNIGRCYQNMGEPDKALSSFREYLRKAQGLDAKQREEIQGYMKEMEDLKRARAAPKAEPASSPPASAQPASAQPAPAARPAAPPPPAVPRLEAPPPSDEDEPSAATNLKAAPSSKTDASDESALYTRWWFWTGLAVVVAGGVAAAVVLSSSSSTPSASTTLGTMSATLK